MEGTAIIASIIAKFKQIPRERFGNTSKRSFKNHKNSEIACYPLACSRLSDCGKTQKKKACQGSKLATNWSHMRLDFWLCA